MAFPSTMTTTAASDFARMASYRYTDVELSLFDDTKMTVVTLEILDDSPKFGRVPTVTTGFHFALSGPQDLRDYLDNKMLQYGATIRWKEGTLEGAVRKPFGKDVKLQLFLAWIEEGFGGLAAVSSTGTFYVFQQGAKKLSKNFDDDDIKKKEESKKKKVFLKVSVENDDPKEKGEPYKQKKKELKKKKKEEQKMLKKMAKKAATEMGEAKTSIIKQWIKDVSKSKRQVSPEQQKKFSTDNKSDADAATTLETTKTTETTDDAMNNNEKEISDRKEDNLPVVKYNTCDAFAAITTNIRTQSIPKQDRDALTAKIPDADKDENSSSAAKKEENSRTISVNDKRKADETETETVSSTSFDNASCHSLKATLQDRPTSRWSRLLRRITCCGSLE